MPLRQIRERQKIIIWVTAIVLVPIFAFTFGVPMNQVGADRPLLEVQDTVYSQRECDAFLHRMRATQDLMLPRTFMGYRYAGMLLLQLQAARAAGLGVADAEIGTFVRERLPQFVDAETQRFDQAKYREHLRTRLNIDPAEFRLGVEEALLLKKFEELLRGSAIASPLESYALWAQSQSKVTYDRVGVTVEDYADAARAGIADMEQAVAAYLEEHAGQRDLLTPGQWRLEYIVVPFDATEPGVASEEEVARYFGEHRDAYQDKTLDEVREEVQAAVVREKQRAAAEYVVAEDVDRTLARLAAPGTTVTAEAVIQGNAVLKAQADQGKVQIGDTGEKPLTPQEMLNHPVLGNCEALVELLAAVDRIADDTERQEAVARLSMNFNERGEANLQNEKGVFKVRARSYTVGEARDPEEDEEFRKRLVQTIIDTRARELAREAIEALRQKVLDGTLEGVPVETEEDKSLFGVPELAALAEPEATVDLPTEVRETEEGFGFLILRARHVPTYAEYQIQPETVRDRYRREALFRMRYMGRERQTLWQQAADAEVRLLVQAEAE